MKSNPVIQSFIGGNWIGVQPAVQLVSAINGKAVANTHAEENNFKEAVRYAREIGNPGLLALDFQERAARLKALALYLNERKEALYAISHHTGATRADSWIDIEGGTSTLFAYASIGSNELPSGNVVHEGSPVQLGKQGQFFGSHILVPRNGVAVHINAFNFPIWGLLEKFAPTFLAGMSCIVKPATATSYLTEAMVRLAIESGILPAGSLQLVIGSAGDLLDHLDGLDVVTFTGSADTAAKLRVHPNLIRQSIPFNAEADSLNCAILGPDVSPEDEEFDLFVKEVVREMTTKAGQKCTAIRRVIVPEIHLDEVVLRLKKRLSAVTVGDPSVEGVRMGPLASHAQMTDVLERIALLAKDNEVLFGAEDALQLRGEGVQAGAFVVPTLILCRNPFTNSVVHEVEAFGPVSTIMPYGDLNQAVALAVKGRGSLVGSLVTRDANIAARVIPEVARYHGRMLVLDRESAPESTGHGSPLPHLKHGGPGRAGGGEELGGIRAVKHYLQRCAVQGSPSMISAITGEYLRGAKLQESDIHPFRRYFEDLQIADSLLTHRRTVSEADIVAFGGLSGDYFYMHFDEIAARESQFGQRIAHGYFVLSAAAGLFVSPAPGPVLANYGLDSLRFVKPVGIGDTIQARLTCKRKIDRNKKDAKGVGQGVVVWDVAVTNQLGELVATYDILTLVSKKS